VIATVFRIHAGESITLEQEGPPGAVFAFEPSPDLAAWSTILTRTLGAAGLIDFTFTPTRIAYYWSTFSDGSTDPVLGVVTIIGDARTRWRCTPTNRDGRA
jgi:hypothetical protein